MSDEDEGLGPFKLPPPANVVLLRDLNEKQEKTNVLLQQILDVLKGPKG